MNRQRWHIITFIMVCAALLVISCSQNAHQPLPPTTLPLPPRSGVVEAYLDQPFTLGIEQSALLASPSASGPLTVTLLALAEELRCPVGPTIACESAGYASFHIRLTDNTTSATVTLATDGGLPAEEAQFDHYEIALKSVEPKRTDDHRLIDQSEYLVTLIIVESPTVNHINPNPTAPNGHQSALGIALVDPKRSHPPGSLHR